MALCFHPCCDGLVYKMGLNSVGRVFTELRSCLSFYRRHCLCKPGQSVVEAQPALGANAVGGGAIRCSWFLSFLFLQFFVGCAIWHAHPIACHCGLYHHFPTYIFLGIL